MIDPPRRAVRPVEADAVAHLAAEQFVAGHAERPRLGVEQRVLDGTQPLRHHAARRRPRQAVEFRVDALMVAGTLADDPLRHLLDDGGDARRPEALVELAPADAAVLVGPLYEVRLPPAGVPAKRLP